MTSQESFGEIGSSDYNLPWEVSTSTINKATVKGINILCMETVLENNRR